jgi:RecA-family ATPase
MSAEQLILHEGLLAENIRWNAGDDPALETYYQKQMVAVLAEEKRRDHKNDLPELPDDDCKAIFDKSFESFYERGKKERRKLEEEQKKIDSAWRPMSMTELLSRPESDSVSWIVDQYVPQGGLVALCAYPKTGKTTLAYSMAVSIAQGKSFLGKETIQGGVLILAVEEHPRDVKIRLKRFGATEADPIFVHAGPMQNNPENIQAIRDFIAQNKIVLLIIDSLSMFWGVQDENNNAEIVREMSPLLDIAHQTNAAVLPIHHERKSGGEDGRSIRAVARYSGLSIKRYCLSGK